MDSPEEPVPEVGESWESFRHYPGRVTKVESGGTQITWEPTTWMGDTRTYGISMFRELFTKMEDEPKGE